MSCCGHCRDAGDFFDLKTAQKDLKRYHRRGPDKSTRLLLNDIRQLGVEGNTLIDIGGGIGAIQIELFRAGLDKAINIDASVSYQKISREEAGKRGFEDQTVYRFGDASDILENMENAEFVTLDRVICCYPFADKLLLKSLQKTKTLIGLVFPRERWLSRIIFRAGNIYFRLKKSDFRSYLHSARHVHSLIVDEGFQQKNHQKTFLWHVKTYIRR